MKSLKSVVYGVAVCAAAVAFALPGEPASAQQSPIVIKIHNFHSPRAGANTRLMNPWAKRMAENTGGRVKVEVYPSMQLGGKPTDLYGQARSGVVDGIWTATGFTPGKFPLTEVFTLPFVSGNGEATSAAVMDMWASTDWLKKEYAETTPMLFHVSPSDAFHTKKAIRKIEDLKGMKIRAPNRNIAIALKTLGASVIGMPLPKAVTSLQRGVIEGAATSWAMGKAVKICDLTKYSTDLPGFSKVVFVFTMNTKKWNSLPRDIKRMVRADLNVARAKELGAWWDKDDVEGMKYCAKSGEIIRLNPAQIEDWKARTAPLVDAWVRKTTKESGIDAAALLADARRLVAKHAN